MHRVSLPHAQNTAAPAPVAPRRPRRRVAAVALTACTALALTLAAPGCAQADAPVAPGALTQLALTQLSGVTVPAATFVLFADLPSNPWVTGLWQDGNVLGSAGQVSQIAPTMWRASWLVDASYLAGKSATYRIRTTKAGLVTFDQSVKVRVAALSSTSGTASASSASSAASSSASVGANPLAVGFPSGAAPTVNTTAPAMTSIVSNIVYRNYLLSAPNKVAFTAINAMDTGVTGSKVVGGVRAQWVSRVTVDQSVVSGGSVAGVGGTAAQVTNSYITSNIDGLDLTGGAHGPRSLVAGNRIEAGGGRPTRGVHNDGIQFWQGGNATITDNWISGWSNSAVMIKSDLEDVPGDGPISDITLDGNYLAAPTADYVLYIADGGKGLPTYITVTNNVFGPSRAGALYPVSNQKFVRTADERARAVADGVPGAAAWVVWSNNVDARTGAEIVPPGGWISYP